MQIYRGREERGVSIPSVRLLSVNSAACSDVWVTGQAIRGCHRQFTKEGQTFSLERSRLHLQIKGICKGKQRETIVIIYIELRYKGKSNMLVYFLFHVLCLIIL